MGTCVVMLVDKVLCTMAAKQVCLEHEAYSLNVCACVQVAAMIRLQVKAGSAKPSPPVGPALGQHGVNM